MPSANPNPATAAAAAGTSRNPNPTAPFSSKPEHKPFSNQTTTDMLEPSSSSTSGPIRINGSEHDAVISKSQLLARPEVLKRRARRTKQLARIYRDNYWELMEEMKLKYREYCWEYGKSPFVEDEASDKVTPNCTVAENGNSNGNYLGLNVGIGNVSNRCAVHGCKAKAMALTRFCHMHILADVKQKLYKACEFSVKSSTTGPILCGKPILKTTVPSYCPPHFAKAEKHMARALKKAGLNVSSTSKLAPKFHVIVAEYVRQIQHKRRASQRANLQNAQVKEENHS